MIAALWWSVFVLVTVAIVDGWAIQALRRRVADLEHDHRQHVKRHDQQGSK